MLVEIQILLDLANLNVSTLKLYMLSLTERHPQVRSPAYLGSPSTCTPLHLD